MNILLNGELASQIAITDRAVQYGDGLFETIALIRQKLHNWERHFQRLSQGANLLGFDPPDEKLLRAEIDKLIQFQSDENHAVERAIVKIILTRGSGGRGYAIPEYSNVQRIISLHTWPEYPQNYYTDGVDIAELKFRLGIQSHLSSIKHLNRLEQIMAKKELGSNYQEALILNHNSHIIEGVSSNIYFVHKGVLCMPDLKCSGIAGTIREQIRDICQAKQIPYQVADYSITLMPEVSEVFLSNSIIGIWPVKQISLLEPLETPSVLKLLPGPIYRQLGAEVNRQLLHPY